MNHEESDRVIARHCHSSYKHNHQSEREREIERETLRQADTSGGGTLRDDEKLSRKLLDVHRSNLLVLLVIDFSSSDDDSVDDEPDEGTIEPDPMDDVDVAEPVDRRLCSFLARFVAFFSETHFPVACA